MTYGIEVNGNGVFNDVRANRLNVNNLQASRGYLDSIGVGGSSHFTGSGITANKVKVTEKIPVTLKFTKSNKENRVTINWDLLSPLEFNLGDLSAITVVNSSSDSSSNWCSCGTDCNSRS